jgi:hypothetical protein
VVDPRLDAPRPAVWKPWEGRWQVCFLPGPLHPLFKVLQSTLGRRAHLEPPFQHCLLIQPVEGDRWLMVEWTLMQLAVSVVGRTEIAVLHRLVTQRGAMLEYSGADKVPKATLWQAWQPTTCVTVVRSVMGLPPRHFLTTIRELWYELLDRGAVVLIDLPQERRKSSCRVAAAAATTTPSGR